MPDPAMTTTARDMAILAAALVRDHPELYSWHAIKEYEYNSIRQQNRNSLLWRDDTVDGIKTGHTEAAGYCLVASAQRNGMRLISVVAGTESSAARTRLSQALLEYGFRFFETHGMYNAGEAVGTARVWKGEQPELNYGVEQDLFVTVPRGQVARIRKEIILDEPIIAPVAKNQRLGEIRLSLGGETLIVRDLIAISATEEAGIISRLLDRVRLMFY
jgi:serine-type D-Ala-D-Ala carboxypeptidase (penicillin-binding protein 5/6)